MSGEGDAGKVECHEDESAATWAAITIFVKQKVSDSNNKLSSFTRRGFWKTYRREYYFVLLFSFIHGFWFIITVFSMLVYLKVFPCMSLALEASSMKWNIWSGIQTEDV